MVQVIRRKLICSGLSDQILICNELSLCRGIATIPQHTTQSAVSPFRLLLSFSALFRAVANNADHFGLIEELKWITSKSHFVSLTTQNLNN